MKGFWRLSVSEFRLFLRQPMAIFFTLAFPLLLLGIFGGIYGNEQTEFFGGHGYIDTMVPAFIGLITAMTGFTSIPGLVASCREKGGLRRLKASPVSSSTVLTAWTDHLVNIGVISGLAVIGIIVSSVTFKWE